MVRLPFLAGPSGFTASRSRTVRSILAAERLESRSLLAPVAAGPSTSVPDLAAASDSGWSSTDNKTSINTPVFSGFAATGAVSVNLYDGKAFIGSSAIVEGVGQWVFTAPALSNGKHSIAAQAVDATGRAGRLSKPLVVEIGSARPAAPTFALDAKSNSGIKSDDRTNVVAPVIAGKAAAGTAVMLWVDGTLAGTASVSRKGAWSFRLPSLSEGPHTVTAAVGNVFGLQSDFVSRTIVTDTVRPTVALSYVQETGTIVASFSRPVTGVTLKGLRIAGTTDSGVSFDLPLTDANVKRRVGSIVISNSPDFRTYTLRMQKPLTEPGVYTLTLNAASSRIVDALAGNPLQGDATLNVVI
jgi:hypothetical protein